MAARTVDLLGETWDSLDVLLGDLTEDEWKRGTDCPGWSVQDHVSHLIDYESRLLGRPGPDHQVDDLPHIKNAMGASNEIGVDYRRTWPGAKVLKEFREVMAARRAQLEALTDEDLAAETQTPIGKGTVADLLTLRLMDTWTHEQDIRRAVGRPGHTEGPAVDGAVSYFVGLMPYAVGKKAGAPDGSTVVLHIGERAVPIEVVEGRARAVELEPADASVRIRMDAGTFAALVNGRTTSLDGVTIEGDRDLGERIATNLNVMI